MIRHHSVCRHINPRPFITAIFALAGLLGCCLPTHAQEARFYAAKCPAAKGTTWGVLERDGANRVTQPYLSSMVGGEAQVGSIASPPFVIAVDTIRFTIRGHDGQSGGRGENFVALLDNKTDSVLRKTPAPGNDALVEKQWDAGDLKGRTVRMEVVDRNSQNAYAWLGIGKIDAGHGMMIDFRQGIPDGWKMAAPPADRDVAQRKLVRHSPVPFQVDTDAYTWIPQHGLARIPIGVKARRLFLLGCTVPANDVVQTYGQIDIVYADDARETYPLVYGFTLEGVYKTPSLDDALHILPVGDATQYLLAIRPADKVIRQIELRRAAGQSPRPRVSAITCLVDGDQVIGKTLEELKPFAPAMAELEWITEHTLSATGPTWEKFADKIRAARGTR